MSTEQVMAEQQADWLDGPAEPELPRRPRRRLLRVGENPIQLALTGVLLIACGFIGGVLVEKGQSSSNSSAGSGSGLASRFAALRAAASGGSGASAGGASAGNGGSRGASLFGAGGAGGAGGLSATVGQVAYVSGSTLYVTNAEGNTVKVKTSNASTVSKTVKSDVKGIHPGETVIVTGSAGANGAVRAESIRVSEAGAGGGLGALFGGGSRNGAGGVQGGGTSARGGISNSSGTSGSGGEPALFGK